MEQLVERLLAREGGYVDHADDPGGPTRYGITEAVARQLAHGAGVSRLSRDRAARIYRERYWTAPRLDRVAERSPAVAEELFDTGVNMGPAVAARFLQRALAALGRTPLAVDGRIGPATLAALDALLARRGRRTGERVLLRALNCLQGARYIELAEARPANEAFLFGWLDKRVA
jgi:lysozyme family protein